LIFPAEKPRHESGEAGKEGRIWDWISFENYLGQNNLNMLC
jgi:hypothetical protein